MSNAIAKTGPMGMATATPWDQMHAQAQVLVKSGFLPDSIRTPEQAIAIMLTGEELGIPKMLALRSINVIKGKPTLSADLMAGLVQREIDRHGDGEFTVMPPTADACTVIFRRWHEEGVRQLVYTMEDAKRAGLTNNQNYAKHPGAMLRARATSTAARMGFPDVVSGLYAPEELDADDPPSLRVVDIAHGLDTNADDLPERQIGVSDGVLPNADRELWREDADTIDADPETGEIIDADVAPIVQQTMTTADAEPSGKITKEQSKLIVDIAKQLAPNPDELKKFMSAFSAGVTGISNPNLLREDQAKDLIQHMLAELNARKDVPM